MVEKNILLKMAIEKNRMIKETISNFLGHEPSAEEKKDFKVMHSLGESNIYFRGELIGHVTYQKDEDLPDEL